MAYDYEDYYDEDDEEEQEERVVTTMEDTKIKMEIDTESLQRSIITAVHSELESTLKAFVLAEVRKEILPELKKEVVNHTHEIVQSLIDDIYNNDKISIGGGWREAEEEISFKEFVRREIKGKIDEGSFKNSSGRTVNFAEYIKNGCIDSAIERELNKNIDEIRKDINSKLKTLFDVQTKNMLSETVLSVLMASETYQNINNGVKRLADKSI